MSDLNENNMDKQQVLNAKTIHVQVIGDATPYCLLLSPGTLVIHLLTSLDLPGGPRHYELIQRSRNDAPQRYFRPEDDLFHLIEEGARLIVSGLLLCEG